ncbi:WD40-repeat-containing domain protein [Lentinula guzmanii]|uniref:WD40-repeat-containing domain protein n=1 Tax=Lentinula guzmanii TaxID=2804957 RepID=A0AA38J9S7_9AGAR|nr:WD40-repeat-containing domain protein [Lentinula guzmanii]
MATKFFSRAHHFTVNNSSFNNYSEVEDIQQKLEQKLKPVTDTWLDKNKVCLEGTRTDIIERISQWIKSPNGSQTLLLCGEAGTGKSTISHTIGSNFEDQLGAFFCFNRASAAIRTPSNALRTIAYMLGINFPEIGTELWDKIQKNRNILRSNSIVELWETLIVGPAQVMANSPQQVLIIIDALDESGQKEDGQRKKLLSLLFNGGHKLPRGFHVFITSRPEIDVIGYLPREPLDPHTTQVQAMQVQHMGDIQGTKNDIYQYVCFRMMNNEVLGNLEEHQCRELAEKAGEFFQWADIVCSSLNQFKGGMTITQRYQRFMNLNKPRSDDLHALDETYEFIFKDAMAVNDEDAMKGYRSIMSQVLAAFEPLSQATLQKLQTGDDVDTVRSVLSFLGSLFTGISQKDVVRPVHTSVLDFLLDKERSKEFWVDLQQGHELLAKGSLHVMFRGLHFNMGKLESSYVMNSEIKDLETKLSKSLKPEIKYACRWWDLHFQNMWQSDSWVKNMEQSDSGVENTKAIDSWVENLENFFFHYPLYWMEVLGLMKEIRIASRTAEHTIIFLDNLKGKMEYSELKKCMTDILQFIQIFGKGCHLFQKIPNSTKSDNCSYVFSRWQENCIWIRDGSIRIWNADTGEAIGDPLKGHSNWVSSVAFSPDGKRIVSGSDDKSIRIWNADTGEAIGDPLQGHSSQVTSVAFSPDGNRIVSGSWNASIRIWNADTGEAIGDPLQGHFNHVTSVAFSPDGKRIVSGSCDESIRIWNADTGEAIGDPLQGHSHIVNSVAFSPDGKRIVSGSDDKSIRIWNADTQEAIGDPLQGHSDAVNSVAFSPDGKRIVSGSDVKSIRMWNADTGEAIGDSLWGHSDRVNSVAFSPDGKRIVSGSWDWSIRIWNVDIGEVIGHPLQGHSSWVTSVALSPDGKRIVSGSEDKSIRIWNADTGEAIGDPLQGHLNPVTSAAFSPDGKRIVSGSMDCSIRIWNADTGEAIGDPLKEHSNSVNSVAFSPDGKRIVSGSWDKSIRIWNADTGEAIGDPLQGHLNPVTSVAFSPDGKRIVSGSMDCSIRIWNADTGEAIGNPLQGHSYGISSLAFSPDGKRIVSGSWDRSIRIWNADTAEAIGDPLQGHSDAVNPVAFSPDGKRIVSGSWDRSIRSWNADTGEAIGDPLQGHFNPVTSVAFSPDGKRIVSGSWDRSIRIWNADTGEAIGNPLQGHSYGVSSLAFSPDGKRIVSGSWDRSIRIWNADTAEAIGDPLQGHSDPVNSVAFSPGGKRTVSGSEDESIRIWNADIGEVIGDPLQGHPHEVTLVTFSPDDRRAVSIMQDESLTGSNTTSGNHKSIKHSQNPHPYLINQYFSFYSCHIDDEGWLHGWHSDLGFSVIIIWIPPKFRPTLLFPPTHVIISQNSSCTLDLHNFAHGKDWIQCSRSNVAPVFR